jgi:hypothetical protein
LPSRALSVFLRVSSSAMRCWIVLRAIIILSSGLAADHVSAAFLLTFWRGQDYVGDGSL